MTTWIESNFGLVLSSGIIAGLLFPGIDSTPAEVVTILLAVMIFLSAFKLSPEEVKNFSLKSVSLFYLLRFLAVPVVLYLMSTLLVPEYAPAVLLFSLMPAAAASPGLTSVLGGNVTFAFSLVLTSTLLTPFLIPIVFALVFGQTIAVDSIELFQTLATVIFLPLVLYFLTRRFGRLRRWCSQNGNWLTVLLLSIVAMFATAASRQVLLSDPVVALESLIILFFLFLLYYAFGWRVAGPRENSDKRAYAVCSGANNNSLAAGVALLHFSPEIVIFCVASEIPWMFAFILFKRWLNTSKANQLLAVQQTK